MTEKLQLWSSEVVLLLVHAWQCVLHAQRMMWFLSSCWEWSKGQSQLGNSASTHTGFDDAGRV